MNNRSIKEPKTNILTINLTFFLTITHRGNTEKKIILQDINPDCKMGDWCHLKKNPKPTKHTHCSSFWNLVVSPSKICLFTPILLSYTATFCPSNQHKNRFCLPHARKQQQLLHSYVKNLQPMEFFYHHKNGNNSPIKVIFER